MAILCFLAAALTFAATAAHGLDDELLISSPNFSLQGSWATNITSPVRQFLGVPYAEPPTGAHRFRPPVTKKPYRGTLQATEFGAVCMQFDTGAPSVFSEYLPGHRVTTPSSEDCLTLNIWTPPRLTPGELLPVMIWIPGGALVSGGSSVPYTNGARFTSAHNIIVVSINYRVNIFGFPGAAGLDGRNLNPGFLDQRMAVEWVYNNIGYFGGDPNRITLFGQSAGGSSTDIFSYAWFNDPLVNGLIIQSGAVGINQFAMNRTSNFTYVSEKVGCGGLGKDAELTCMQKVNATDIMDVYVASASDGIAFGAMVDEETVFSNWTERRERGLIAKLPTLLGSTSNEYASLYSPFDGSPPNQTELDLLSDEVFSCRAAISSRERQRLGILTWRYRYTGVWPNLNPLPWLGAYHSSEIPLVFGTSDLYSGANTPEEAALSGYMSGAWAAFARDPEHGLEEYGWPLYVEELETLVVLGEPGSAGAAFSPGGKYDAGCVPGVG